MSHDLQAGAHAVAQHTPCAQYPLMQSSGEVHDVLLEAGSVQVPTAEQLPLVH
jgi:hypothetical protein